MSTQYLNFKADCLWTGDISGSDMQSEHFSLRTMSLLIAHQFHNVKIITLFLEISHYYCNMWNEIMEVNRLFFFFLIAESISHFQTYSFSLSPLLSFYGKQIFFNPIGKCLSSPRIFCQLSKFNLYLR